MQKVLIVSGHPNLENSHANKTVLEQTLQLIPDAEVSRLDLLYSDFKIDVKAEQEKLINADIVIWQFPFYWYALPALMKKYLDDVYVFGFAHGVGGDKLKGKTLILSFTTGAPEELYDYGKAMNYPIDDFLPSLIQVAKLCQMEMQEPIYSMGMQYIPNVYPIEALETLKAKSKSHAEKLATLVHKIYSLR
ncbi:Putative NADPH-quinone reductase (modulator of drug activity B) [Flexibacter flexilis DSM 6793]|uniref:Putative NADPH-quinone reductase (Modulator of drug activity B) n=1 Tax=Flexibacter flexilis DSM 6793 TaxID=927664 RepID=A0A1I1DLZ5_9BACT|nr:NAD(P)H-dependent oxidoreductase [Flexibacter flexilis]SFB75911.1 Putative NADPH-quinone reductase (modulator of drug activity B) [Flexibacter flexilis DSM 6793]